MTEIKWDQKALERAAMDAARNALPRMQREFDAVGRRSKNKPVATVKRDLSQLARKLGLDLSDGQLTVYAENMTAGIPIKLQI